MPSASAPANRANLGDIVAMLPPNGQEQSR
jgi:hypothetical protein